MTGKRTLEFEGRVNHAGETPPTQPPRTQSHGPDAGYEKNPQVAGIGWPKRTCVWQKGITFAPGLVK